MIVIALPETGTFAAWRTAARDLAGRGVAPGGIDWRLGEAPRGLFDGDSAAPGPVRAIAVPAAFLDLAQTVIWHRDPQRFARLYALLVRLADQPRLMGDGADAAVRSLRAMAQAVRRDLHKMHAFLRFHEVPADGPRRAFAAWYEPYHRIVEPAAPFFASRFTDMDWTIQTPDGRADFRDGALHLGPAGPRPAVPPDATEALWTTYYRHIFNPARVNPQVMRQHMPQKFWKNMPEAAAIPDLIAGAEARVRAMRDAAPLPMRETVAPGPEAATLEEARALARDCRRCGLCMAATQTVFGEGCATARLMVVGEQPGDAEDRAGRPFVGPAGAVLDQALAEAGLDRQALWLTNAVKHFKFTPRGKQRLHQNPDRGEIEHCRWWLDLERRLIRPRVTLALGGSAARALTGQSARLAARRGATETATDGGLIRLSWHPAAILRQPDVGRAAQMRAELTADLAEAARLAGLS